MPAPAISRVVRNSYAVADVASKADITNVKRDFAEVRKDLTAQITDIIKDIEARFEKTDSKIADVRKDLSEEIGLLSKDVQHTENGLLIKLSAVMLTIVELASTIVTVVIKLL